MSLAQLVQEQANNAPKAGYETANYGQLTCVPHILTWQDGGAPKREPMKEGDVIGKGQDLELHFEVKISELNPQLDFEATDRVVVRKSGKNAPTDWSEITEPSLIATFGENWAEKIMSSPYVLTGSEDNLKGNASEKGNIYQVMTFKEVYPDKAACIAARDARFGGKVAVSATTAIPTEIINQVAGLIKSVGIVSATDMASKTAPFSQYDTATLIAEAQK